MWTSMAKYVQYKQLDFRQADLLNFDYSKKSFIYELRVNIYCKAI